MAKKSVALSTADKVYLKKQVSKGQHPARSVRRARMLLLLNEDGKKQKQIARECACSESRVTNLLTRYAD